MTGAQAVVSGAGGRLVEAAVRYWGSAGDGGAAAQADGRDSRWSRVAPGCGGRGDQRLLRRRAAPSPTTGAAAGTAAEVLRRAADVLAGAGSSKARTSMEMATGGTRVTIRGEGVYDFSEADGAARGRCCPRTRRARPSTGRSPNCWPRALCIMKNRGAGVPADKWVRVDTTTLADGNLVTGGATDPLAAAELLRGARGVTYVGEDRGRRDHGAALPGDHRHRRGPRGRRRRRRGGRWGRRRKGSPRTRCPFDAYLDDEGRLRKVRHRFSFVNDGGGRSLSPRPRCCTTSGRRSPSSRPEDGHLRREDRRVAGPDGCAEDAIGPCRVRKWSVRAMRGSRRPYAGSRCAQEAATAGRGDARGSAGGTTVQDHVALAEIELCGELIIAASAADEERLSPDRIDEVLKVAEDATGRQSRRPAERRPCRAAGGRRLRCAAGGRSPWWPPRPSRRSRRRP